MTPIERLLAVLGVGVAIAAAAWLVAVAVALAVRSIRRSLRIARADLAELRRVRGDSTHIRQAEALWRVIHREYPPGGGPKKPA